MPDLYIPKLLTLLDAGDTRDLAQEGTTFKRTEAVGQKSDFFALVAGSQVHSTLPTEVLLQQNTPPPKHQRSPGVLTRLRDGHPKRQPAMYLYELSSEWFLEGGSTLLDQLSAPSYTRTPLYNHLPLLERRHNQPLNPGA